MPSRSFILLLLLGGAVPALVSVSTARPLTPPINTQPTDTSSLIAASPNASVLKNAESLVDTGTHDYGGDAKDALAPNMRARQRRQTRPALRDLIRDLEVAPTPMFDSESTYLVQRRAGAVMSDVYPVAGSSVPGTLVDSLTQEDEGNDVQEALLNGDGSTVALDQLAPSDDAQYDSDDNSDDPAFDAATDASASGTSASDDHLTDPVDTHSGNTISTGTDDN